MIRLSSRCRHTCNIRCTTFLSVIGFVAMLAAAFPAAAHAETAYGLTTTNQLIVFDVDNPGALLAQVPVTGLAPGDSLVGIDFGPFDVQLYGVGQSGRLYIVNPISGLARVMGAGPWNALTGTEFAVDFHPGLNRVRVMSDADINLTIDAATGVVTTETPLNPANPSIGGAAYAQFGINGPRLYVIDTATDRLGYLDMPSDGTITDNGPLGVDVTDVAGFDMTVGNTMYAALTVGGVPTLYRIFSIGPTLTPLGPIAGGTPLRGLAVLSRHVTMWSVDTVSQHLVRYSSRSVPTVLTELPIAGTQPGEKILALDFRPSTAQLYGLGSTNRLYRFDLTTGQATQIGGPDAFTPFVANPSVDIDFNPITDELRITGYNGDSNVRMNPDTGAVTVDTALNPSGVEGAAYSIQPGAVSTTLYGIRHSSFFDYSISRIGGPDGAPSPNEGLVTDLWDSTIGFGDSHVGLDMSADGIMYGSGDRLSLDMFLPTRGAGSFGGAFPASTNTDGVDGLAIEPFGRLRLASADVVLTEAGPAAIVTVNRELGQSGVLQVDYAVTGVTATDGADFTGSSGTLVFLDGETSKQIVIPIAQDAEDEADETFSVTLSNLFLAATIDGPATATVTILDDDPLGKLAPTIVITTPTADPAYVSVTSTISLAGTAADDVAVTEVTWSNDRGGSGEATGTANWNITQIPLLPGQNVITVTAHDGFGKSAHDTITVALNVKSYSFAEGATGGFFDTDLLLGNHYDNDLPVTITYLKDVGEPVVQQLVLPAHSRTTVLVDEVPGMEEATFSTVVDSTSGLPFAVERTQRWDASGYGAATEKGSDGPNLTWYFAEGSQGHFQTYLLLGNPSGSTNEVTVRFLLEGGPAVTRVFELAPRSRLTLDAGTIPDLIHRSFGTVVTFTQPGVAERAMYFGERLFEGGTAAAGVNAPSTTWFHAEGATGPFFTSFLLLANPGNADANVTVTYLRSSGGPITVQKVVPALGRLTTNLTFESPDLANAAVATRVVSDQPIVSERAMYWPGPAEQWYESHGSFGVAAPASAWALAEGRVGGAAGYQTFILLANEGNTAATVEITFYRTNGTMVTKAYEVAAASRLTVYVNAEVPELVNESFSALVSADLPIVVERALYSNAEGVTWAAGTNATGTPIP
jgi:hypothetical protein